MSLRNPRLLAFLESRLRLRKSKSQMYADIAAGLCVKPVKVGSRASAFPLHEIDALIAARIANFGDDEIRELVDLLHERRKLIDPYAIAGAGAA